VTMSPTMQVPVLELGDSRGPQRNNAYQHVL